MDDIDKDPEGFDGEAAVGPDKTDVWGDRRKRRPTSLKTLKHAHDKAAMSRFLGLGYQLIGARYGTPSIATSDPRIRFSNPFRMAIECSISWSMAFTEPTQVVSVPGDVQRLFELALMDHQPSAPRQGAVLACEKLMVAPAE